MLKYLNIFRPEHDQSNWPAFFVFYQVTMYMKLPVSGAEATIQEEGSVFSIIGERGEFTFISQLAANSYQP